MHKNIIPKVSLLVGLIFFCFSSKSLGLGLLYADYPREVFDEKESQNAMFIRVVGNLFMYGICGGHGPQDGGIVHCAAKAVPDFIEKEIRKYLDVPFGNKITAGFNNAQVQCEQMDGGASAVVALFDLKDLILHVANVGDARAVLSSIEDGNINNAIELSVCHRPDEPRERKRIAACAEEVVQVLGEQPHSRVCIGCNGDGDPIIEHSEKSLWYIGGIGGALLSRSIGDYALHQRYRSVISDPSISKVHLDGTQQFLILANHRLWDAVTDSAAVAFVHARLAEMKVTVDTITGKDAKKIARGLVELVQFCSKEDVAAKVMLIFFQKNNSPFPGSPYSQSSPSEVSPAKQSFLKGSLSLPASPRQSLFSRGTRSLPASPSFRPLRLGPSPRNSYFQLPPPRSLHLPPSRAASPNNCL